MNMAGGPHMSVCHMSASGAGLENPFGFDTRIEFEGLMTVLEV